MSDRRATNALRWPVAGPAYTGRVAGRLAQVPAGTRYLTGSQRALLWAIRRQTSRGPVTLERLCDLLGTTSRGRLWLQLARLRQLGLIGFRADAVMALHDPLEPGARGGRGARRFSPGRHGRTLIWLPRAARLALRAALGRRLAGGNDSVSTPFGGFCSARGVARAWGAAGPPGSAPAAAARAGPVALADLLGSGRRLPTSPHRPPSGAPPRLLYVHCPRGHRSPIGRSSWRRTSAELHGVWAGPCRHCQAWTTETVTIRLPTVARLPSPAELEDPELLERRRRQAAAFAAEGFTLTEEQRRFYGPAVEPAGGDDG